MNSTRVNGMLDGLTRQRESSVTSCPHCGSEVSVEECEHSNESYAEYSYSCTNEDCELRWSERARYA
jgi:hypothetical protein